MEQAGESPATMPPQIRGPTVNAPADIIKAFLKEQPEAWGAASDDETSYGFVWRFSDGAMLWIDFDERSGVHLLWQTKTMDKPYQASINT